MVPRADRLRLHAAGARWRCEDRAQLLLGMERESTQWLWVGCGAGRWRCAPPRPFLPSTLVEQQHVGQTRSVVAVRAAVSFIASRKPKRIPGVTMSGYLEEKTEEAPRPAIESFLFGCELSSKSRRYTFEVDEEDECEHLLSLQTISLGGDCKDEFNVVEVIGHNYENKEIAVPVASLKLSCQTMVNVGHFEFQPPVTFCLKSGSGPVHLSGRHLIVSSSFSDDDDDDEDDDDDDEDEDYDDEEDDEEIVAIKPAKKKLKQ